MDEKRPIMRCGLLISRLSAMAAVKLYPDMYHYRQPFRLVQTPSHSFPRRRAGVFAVESPKSSVLLGCQMGNGAFASALSLVSTMYGAMEPRAAAASGVRAWYSIAMRSD